MQNPLDEKEIKPDYTIGLNSSSNTIVGEGEKHQTEASSRPSSESHKATVRGTPLELEAQISDPTVEQPAPVVVPRAQRRGLLARFSFVAEVEEPKHYPRRIKWFITFVVALAAVAAPMGSTIFFPSLLQVSRELHTTPTVTNLSVALYMLSMSIFPLWWSSFSERFGRRSVYVVSFCLYLVFNILSALSKNIAMLVVMRMLSGGASASVQAVGAGTIADVFEVRERGKAMGIFYLGPLMGPLFAPIIGGLLAERWGWRSTMWFLVIYGSIVLAFLTFALPETLKDRKPLVFDSEAKPDNRPELTRLNSRVSVRQNSRKWGIILKQFFIDPLKIVLNLRFPAVLITVYMASIAFCSLYVLNVSIQATFAKAPYNFSTIEIGLSYIPNSVGYFISSILGGRWTDSIMAREARKAGRYDDKGRLIYRPEDRMRENAWVAAFLYPTALVCYGWTVDKGVYWVVPLIANFFFGIGSMLIFAVSTTMLTEFMPKKASSGVAVNNFVRNILSCVGGIVAQPLIDAIGNGWLFTLLGLLATTSSVVIWAMRYYGPRWRKSMDEKMNAEKS